MTEYVYQAQVVDWIDGDTVALEVYRSFDMGFYITLEGTYRGHFRLVGIDTPERGRMNFREATAAAEQLAPVGSVVTIKTEKTDKFGRYLAHIVNVEGQNVGQELIEMGLAVKYGTGEVVMWMGPEADPVVI